MQTLCAASTRKLLNRAVDVIDNFLDRMQRAAQSKRAFIKAWDEGAVDLPELGCGVASPCDPWINAARRTERGLRDVGLTATADEIDRELAGLASVEAGCVTNPQGYQDAALGTATRLRAILAPLMASGDATNAALKKSEGADLPRKKSARPRQKRKATAETTAKRRAKIAQQKADRKISEAWAGGCGQYTTKKELADAFGIPEREAKLALDRHRHK